MSLLPNIYQGLLTGLKSSTLTKWGGASGPTLLADFDFSTPATSWVSGRTGFSSAFATDEWDFQTQTVAGSYDNSVGSATLDNLNGLPDQTAVGIWDGSSYAARTAWEGVDGTTGISCSDSTVGDPGSGDFCVRVVFRCTLDQVTSNDVIVAKRQSSAGNPGWALAFTGSTGSLGITYDDGTTSTVDYIVGTHADGAWHYVTFWLDASESDGFIKSDLVAEQSDLANSLGSISSSSALTINNHWVGHTSSSMGALQVAYVGVCEGANAQNMYDEEFWQHASDPTGLLTTISRASSIGVRVAENQTAMFSDDQLPIGFNSNLNAGAGGLGLYCNSAVTNLLLWSEMPSAQWSGSNATRTDNDGDSPDGFRNALGVTATNTNGFIYDTNAANTASTEYTYSVWVKRNQGTDVSGDIELYDLTAAATIATQAYTATDSWQLVSLTTTTPVGCVSTRSIIRVSTNTESILVSKAQLNLGDARGAYVKTTGSAAALVFSDYRATGSAGEFCKGATGEIEAVWVQGLDATGSSRVFECSNDSNNDNRRSMYVAVTTDRSLVSDDSGVSIGTLNEGSVTLGVEQTGVLKWDDSGGLSSGGGEMASYEVTAPASTLVGTFASADTVTSVYVGNAISPTSSEALDAFIQRIRIWDGER